MNATAGLMPLYTRRLAVTTKTISGTIGQIVTPILWVLVVAPAFDKAIGGFNRGTDYFTYVAVAQITFLVPFTAMFNGINVIVDKQFGITRELLVAPVRRAIIPLSNALGVLTIALVQVALILGLAIARGADFHTSATGIAWVVVGAALLNLGVYGIAETLALKIARQEAYGPLIPAIGVTPWILSGPLFPISALPAWAERLSAFLPWTHALAVLRYGLMRGSDPGLHNIWHLHSNVGMAWLSTAYLAAFATGTLTVAVRVFKRTTVG
jgi:ABC-2 type transport system permease protein